MNEIKALNTPLEGNTEDLEIMISELIDREEYACTGNACAADVCGVHG